MALPFFLYIEIDMRVLRFLILKKHANRHAKISLLFPCGACGQVDIILPSHLRSERSTFCQRFFFPLDLTRKFLSSLFPNIPVPI